MVFPIRLGLKVSFISNVTSFRASARTLISWTQCDCTFYFAWTVILSKLMVQCRTLHQGQTINLEGKTSWQWPDSNVFLFSKRCFSRYLHPILHLERMRRIPTAPLHLHIELKNATIIYFARVIVELLLASNEHLDWVIGVIKLSYNGRQGGTWKISGSFWVTWTRLAVYEVWDTCSLPCAIDPNCNLTW